MYGDDIPRDRVAELYPQVHPALIACAATVRALLEQLCANHDVKVHTVEARAKEPESLREKFLRHPHYERLADAEDLCGVRIVTFYLDDVEQVRDLLHEEFEILKEESRHAQSPETFGYRSLHLIGRFDARRRELPEYRAYGEFRIEFQVRTVLQHAWGVISHSLDYKNEAEIPPEVRRRLFRVAALMETGDELFGSYRAEVHSLRARYLSQTRTEEWTQLPVDLDSVMTSRPRLPVGAVLKVAHDAGFDDLGEQEPEQQRWSAGVLVGVANLAGVETLGQLAERMSRVGRQASGLATLAAVSAQHGFVPFADAMDVTSLSMLLDQPDLRVRFGTTFHPAIELGLDAALREESAS
ncbi:GTP pyrophosphokinase [Streptomyces longispororuber]|uniref:GTP pyrophosphokinase n=1 Tax=Streptomyces longispororuber TaxID=68230 RepID=UPI00210A9D9E|nr:RelA/SpoT domain-containing protein [Streptomyces longispororuber]MCQ4208773.1 RelA/SpoT domain-containing protein [Streptomyces longispororuber]